MKFASNENKAILWKLLTDNGLFNGIDTNYFDNVKDEFETMIVHINNKNKNVSSSLFDINKLFIDAMVKVLPNYKQVNNYTREELNKVKTTEFNNNLLEKQTEFNSYNITTQPKEVTFNDDVDEDPIDIDKLLKEKQKERENINISITDSGNLSLPLPDNIIISSKDNTSSGNNTSSLNTTLLKQILHNQKLIIQHFNL